MNHINLTTSFDKKQEGIKNSTLSVGNDVVECLSTKISSEDININDIKDVPPMFDTIPEGYVNSVAHRGNHSLEEIEDTLEDGSKKLLHIDLDFGKVCKLSCPHCFKNNKELQKEIAHADKRELTQDELKEVILKLKEIGLKSIKFIGAGEPFDNKDFIPFVEFLHENGLGVSVFSKGYVIGNDAMIERLYGEIGLHTSEDLCKKLKELDVSVLLGFNSFDRELQKKYSGVMTWNDYIDFRDKALVNMMNAGLNTFTPGEPTRLAMIMAPMKPENLDEIIEIYDWARMRNIYPLGCPSNEAGLGVAENQRVQTNDPAYVEELKELYTDIYVRNIDHGITTLNRLDQEGISLYPGCHPCTQTTIGAYLTINGELLSCPGHNTENEKLKISPDITQEDDMLHMWQQSVNFRRKGFNQKCMARDGSSLPIGFYKDIMDKIHKHYEQ